MRKASNNAIRIMSDYFGVMETRVPLHNAAAKAQSMESMRSAQIRMIEGYQSKFIESERFTAAWVTKQLEGMLPIGWRNKTTTY